MPVTDQASDFGMTDLSEALRAEEGAALRTSILERLAELEKSAAASLATGLSPADYADAEKLRAALTAARDVVVNFR